ncbi:hypothetical protein [Peredibacter starrii]|uniref:Glutamate--cysteine ligase n=1 Tax=Peredibacter starrii TaxID=28202 RepID=A0AAX4HQU4_9BACT|nr:hypothetical protein [Peredibacter starrii]WPU65710.1 hypothetical protein SOO65_03025 [Peredibacter starrii]
MKFGLEIEKFLFDLKHNRPSDGVFRFIDALSDFELHESSAPINQVTNEFVLNLVEIVTEPSTAPLDVLKGYIENYLRLKSVALREAATLVPLGSMPMEYQPHMTPKWSYFVQNCILDQKIQSSWMLNKDTPLTPAGNCAGMHVHFEVETAGEYLFSNRELQDKFNMGLMLTPMIAFGSSPYFFGRHEASSMRGIRYFEGVYKNYPMNGALPPVMNSSQEVLLFFQKSSANWIELGKGIGLPEEDLSRLVLKKGANWNPIRWNRTWNTIELRCLESDRLDFDCSKFIWATAVMKRMDLKGEGLKCVPIQSSAQVDKAMLDECFNISGNEVAILSSEGIQDIFKRAMHKGLKDPIVEQYLYRVADFARPSVDPSCLPIFMILEDVLISKGTSSELLLERSERLEKISNEQAVDLVHFSIESEKKILTSFLDHFPELSLF